MRFSYFWQKIIKSLVYHEEFVAKKSFTSFYMEKFPKNVVVAV